MTAQEIADRLVGSDKGLTAVRIAKLQLLCQRTKVPLADVLALVAPDQAARIQAILRGDA